jgi:hypothetical protein
MRSFSAMSAICLLGLALFAAGEKKPSSPVPAKKTRANSAGWKLWKSETTGKEYRVKVEKDRLLAEWVNIPPATAKQGAYIQTECRRSGEKWIGTSRIFLPCVKPGEAEGKITQKCHMTLRFEVDSVTRDRISGSAESLRNFDCAKCQVLQTGWAKFSWVPKQ